MSFYSFQSSKREIDFQYRFDIVGNLPIEIAQHIFRMLDPHSTFQAIQVNKAWNRIYESDKKNKKRLRVLARKIRREKLKKLNSRVHWNRLVAGQEMPMEKRSQAQKRVIADAKYRLKVQRMDDNDEGRNNFCVRRSIRRIN